MEESETQVGDELEDRGPEEAEEPERAMWNEGEQWEANEYAVDGRAAAEPRGEAEYQDLEFEALGVEEALGPEEAEGSELNRLRFSQVWTPSGRTSRISWSWTRVPVRHSSPSCYPRGSWSC